MKISEEDKTLVLKVQKVFPEVWMYLQRQANRNTPWPDVIHCLKELLKVGDEIRVPWAFLSWKLKELERQREQKGIDKRVEEHKRRKIESEEDVKNWLRGWVR